MRARVRELAAAAEVPELAAGLETVIAAAKKPEARVAHSAVLVAMTGARDVLEDALVRFTGLKARQRAEMGLTNAYLLLDAQDRPRQACSRTS